MQLPFTKNDEALTLGVEMELQLLDRDTHLLVPKAPEVLRDLKHDRLTKEMFRSTLELITGVCRDVHEVEADLTQTLAEVRKAGEHYNLTFAGTGTNPVANYDERELSSSARYHELLDRNQWLIRRMAVYGLHVHLGMYDGDSCIRYNNFFLQFIPHLIALSASSPYWIGKDTGLASSRPTVYEAHPTSGRPVMVNDWNEFNALYAMLVKTNSIESMKDIWWDLRPSPGYGTLEIRICDGPATMLELESIVAWIHLLAHWFHDHEEEFYMRNNLKPEVWIMRENKWRSIRFGTEAMIISYEDFHEHKLSDSIYYWLDVLQPYVTGLGYEKYVDCIVQILQRGNSATRQRRIMEKSGDIMDVVHHNILEFEAGRPIWS
jgi:carboxylate-amine ligase